MEIIDVTPNTQKDWERIYTEAFPEYEQRPMAELVTLVEQQDAIKMQVIVDDQTIVGVVYLCEIGLSKAFLLYFAIDATIQSKGYGSRALATLKERYKDGVILEAEQVGTQAENEEQRTRRYDFYMRNGLEDKQLLSENSGGVFHLLASTPDISATEYLQAMHAMSIEAIVRRDD
ncbi:GNAT family N-acetyltransferase [Weissella sagaensis]|uniref:GNAT family N-acetyltransferase n=1 Tax=Weissella sagaensis TaxID=2559928 RepID=A0ABW1RUX7_9LACO|nr:GNAT family N-acetyltransferase [Weissella sagaensis]KAA8434541.1 GNAT family N-acetyltransferase [Weissella paramesenteroides]MBU7567533.1 GNAT family N-acetyltransferase [Weissella hellenica]KAA8437500.1 GNAT family N-acetyltransferase [Weissella paramesenteroides]QDJ59726.1 GNAT family N-acetyltransferase [Weissella hellenica]UEG67686.1 GNAT family N-acetyltransferase [Weissella hellenica]